MILYQLAAAGLERTEVEVISCSVAGIMRLRLLDDAVIKLCPAPARAFVEEVLFVFCSECGRASSAEENEPLSFRAEF